jgi:hypothetical protein
MAITFINFTHEMYECAHILHYTYMPIIYYPPHLCIGLPNGPFASSFLIKTLHEFLISLTHAYFICFDF